MFTKAHPEFARVGGGACAPRGSASEENASAVGVSKSVAVGLTVGKLRDLIANLPASMDVRFFASVADECRVAVVETYRGYGRSVLMLSDTNESGADATVIFDQLDPTE